MRPLFVCRSNAARSQMGEAWYNHLTGTQEARSAGTAATDFRVVPFDVRAVMAEVGIELPPEAVPKQLTADMAQSAGRILLMTDFAVPAFLMDNPKVEVWDVPDPRFASSPSGLVVARETIRRLIEQNLL